jgi:hypothetical protein
MSGYITQNSLLLNNLLSFYNRDGNIEKILPIINGESSISLRLIDWFATNYSKKHFTVYKFKHETGGERRFKVYLEYKLKLRAYSKKRFDPFCRWDRITIPYNDGTHIQTTIGQLNFFRWILENKILEYIEKNVSEITADMNKRNSTSKNVKGKVDKTTRKTREELSVSATKSIKKENVEIIVSFD